MNEGWYFDAAPHGFISAAWMILPIISWQMSQLAHAFDVNGRDWIWIEGFEVQFYGRCGVCTLNASHLVIRRNKIHNMLLGIFVDWNGGENQGNDTRIEYNEVYDPLVNEFPWQAIKGSSMEGTAIIVRGHVGAAGGETIVAVSSGRGGSPRTAGRSARGSGPRRVCAARACTWG